MAHALALSVVLFLSLASACAAFGPQSSVPNIAKGVWLRSAVNNTGARCLDGEDISLLPLLSGSACRVLACAAL